MVSPYVVTIFFPESTGSSFTTLQYSGQVVGLGKALRFDIGQWDTHVFDIGAAGLTSSFTTLSNSGGIKELSFSAFAFAGTISGFFASFTAISMAATVKGPSFTTLGFQSVISTARASFTALETSGRVVFAIATSSFTTMGYVGSLFIPPVPRNFADEKSNEILGRRLNRRRRKHDSFP